MNVEEQPIIVRWRRWASASFTGAVVTARIARALVPDSVEIPGAVLADCDDNGDGTVELFLVTEGQQPLQRPVVEKALMEILQSALGERP